MMNFEEIIHLKTCIPKGMGHRVDPLCNLCVLCVSVVVVSFIPITTEIQRTRRLHRDLALPITMVGR